MNFYVDTAKRKRIDHAINQKLFIKSNIRTIQKGEKCLVFSNGTIGKGAISYNYSRLEAIKLLNKLLIELQ
jgi:hypothetical protein